MVETGRKSPRAGIEDTRQRGVEKRDIIYSWLAEYQYSTISIMSKLLGVTPKSQWAFFNREINGGSMRRITVHTVREKLFLLTRDGKDLACEVTEKALNYVTEPSKVSAATVRHNLCVQLAVLERLKPEMQHSFERHLEFTAKDKLPDALLEFEGVKTALEVELSHKRTNRIYRAFYDHIQAMKNGHYHRVEYIFSSASLRNNYKAKFDLAEWPVVERKDGKLRQAERTFSPGTVKGLRDRFSFVVQDFEIKK